MLRTVLESAPARGELRRDADLETAVNMLVGSYYASHLAGKAQRDWPERAVELILNGLINAVPTSSDRIRGPCSA
jgi:hypothetical protein